MSRILFTRILLCCLLPFCGTVSFSPHTTKVQNQHIVRLLAGVFIATAGGFGLSKTKLTLKNRKRLNRKILRALSIFALLGGGALSLNAGFALRKHIKDTKDQKMGVVCSYQVAHPDSLERSRHQESPPRLDVSGHHPPTDSPKDPSLLSEQDQRLLSEQTIKLQRIIRTTLDHQYTLHRSGCINESSNQDDYQEFTPNRGTAPNASAITNYAEYYYQDQTKTFFILKVSLYSTTIKNPEVTYFIIDETHQNTLQTILTSPLSFLRHIKNTSRFKKLDNAATAVPIEVCIQNSWAAIYKNGTLQSIESIHDGNPRESDLGQSPATIADAGSSDDGRLYAGAGRGAAAFTDDPAPCRAQGHSAGPTTEMIAPWDQAAQTPANSYFKLSIPNLKRMVRHQAAPLVEIIKTTEESKYMSMTPHTPIPPGFAATFGQHFWEKNRKQYIQSEKEYSELEKNCTEYTESYVIVHGYMLLKTSLFDKHRRVYKTIINLCTHDQKFLDEYKEEGGRLMFIDRNSIIGCSIQEPDRIYIHSLTLRHQTEPRERISIYFYGNRGDIRSAEIRLLEPDTPLPHRHCCKSISHTEDSHPILVSIDYQLLLDATLWSMNPSATIHRFKDSDCTDLQEIEVSLNRGSGLTYKGTVESKKNTWTHSITNAFTGRELLYTWKSPNAFEVIRPETIATKILDRIRNPSLTPKKLEIASSILNFLPRTLPPLSIDKSFILSYILANVSDMYQSVQKIYMDINRQRKHIQAQVKEILDSQLDEKEQLSLILHAPIVLSILSEKLTSDPAPDLQTNQLLAALIASLRSFTKVDSTTSNSQAILALYEKHSHLIETPKPTATAPPDFARLLNEAAAQLTMQWNKIKLQYRDLLLTQLNNIFTDPQAKELARKYIPLSEYIPLYRLSNDDASRMHLNLTKMMERCTPDLQKILAPYQAALSKIAANKAVSYALIGYNPLLELIHSDHSRTMRTRPLLDLLQETLKSSDQRALTNYFAHSLPEAPRTPPTWQTLTQAALDVYVITPLTLAFQAYCQSVRFTTSIEKELLPLLEPLFADLRRCTQSHSLADFITNAQSLIASFNKTIADNADRFYEIFPPELKEAITRNASNRLQEIEKHCYCIIAEKIHAAIKPRNDRSGVSIFLNARKDSIIKAIQSNQFAEYVLDKLTICTTYLKTKTTSAQNNGLILCTLQGFGFMRTLIAQQFISKIMENINNGQNKTSRRLIKNHLIPLYNACVPIINHFIKIIESRAQKLPITYMQEFMSVVQDALWYFND